MYSTVYKRLGVIVKLLQQIDWHDKDRDRAFEARCWLGLMQDDFCLLLVAVKVILKHCKAASDFLQYSKNSLADAVDIVENMVEGITSLRNESSDDELKSNAEKLCDDNNIQTRILKLSPRVPGRFHDEVVECTVGKKSSPQILKELETEIEFIMKLYRRNEQIVQVYKRGCRRSRPTLVLSMAHLDSNSEPFTPGVNTTNRLEAGGGAWSPREGIYGAQFF